MITPALLALLLASELYTVACEGKDVHIRPHSIITKFHIKSPSSLFWYFDVSYCSFLTKLMSQTAPFFLGNRAVLKVRVVEQDTERALRFQSRPVLATWAEASRCCPPPPPHLYLWVEVHTCSWSPFRVGDVKALCDLQLVPVGQSVR